MKVSGLSQLITLGVILFGLSLPPLNACKCFQLFICFIKRHWYYLIFDHLGFWKPYLRRFSEKIRIKLNSMSGNFFDTQHPFRFNIFGFIDAKYIRRTRPGGPFQSGENTPRQDLLIQQAFYSGHKKGHGLKIHTVCLPNGMDLHVYGPISARRYDIFLFVESDIKDL